MFSVTNGIIFQTASSSSLNSLHTSEKNQLVMATGEKISSIKFIAHNIVFASVLQ